MSAYIKYDEGMILGNGFMYLRDSHYHVSPSGGRHRMAFFKCPYCGLEKVIQVNRVKSGKVSSCGCATSDICSNAAKKHGLSRHPLYRKFAVIKARCFNPNNPHFDNYGGRGIGVYIPWLKDPIEFITYVSCLPNAAKKGLTLDRINNDGNYEPDNLRWVDRHTQSANTRVPKRNKLGVKGVTKEGNKYSSRIIIRGKFIWLGSHETIELAKKARVDYIKANNLTEYSL